MTPTAWLAIGCFVFACLICAAFLTVLGIAANAVVTEERSAHHYSDHSGGL